MTDDVHTVHLGAYTHAHAEAIAGTARGGGIVWWYKAPGFLSQIWESSVRLFVDRARLKEAKAIADGSSPPILSPGAAAPRPGRRRGASGPAPGDSRRAGSAAGSS